MIVRNLRWGNDFGPAEYTYIAELMVTADDKRNYFITCSNFCEFRNVEISEVSLFDLEMEIYDSELDFDYELEKLKKLPIESYDSEINYTMEGADSTNTTANGFERYYDKSMFTSRFAPAIRLGLIALDKALTMENPTSESAAAFIKEYIGEDISSIEFPVTE